MAGQERVSSLADLQALRQEKDEVISILKQIDEQIKSTSKIRLGLQNSNSLADFRKNNDEAIQQTTKMAILEERLAIAVVNRQKAADQAAAAQLMAELKLEQAIEKTNATRTRAANASQKAAEKEAKSLDQLSDDWKQYSLALADAEKKVRNLALTRGLESKEVQEAIKNYNELKRVQVAINEKMGNYRDNVGNYASGWMSFNNIIHETPNFAISAQTGIQALSNNIPMFADEIKKARTEGKSWMGILKELGANLFSFGGIATLATIALTAVPKILQAMTTDTDKALKKFKSFNEVQQEATRNTLKEKVELEALLLVARDEQKSKAERSAAIKKINDIMPDYLGDIKMEEINTDATTKKVNTYIQQLGKKALAQAYISKIQELYVKQIDAENKSLVDNVKWYQQLWAIITTTGNAGQLQVELITKGVSERTKNIKTIKDEIEAVKNKFNEDLKSGKAIMDLDKTVNEKKGKHAEDLTNEILAAEARRKKAIMEAAKAELEVVEANFKAFAADEKNSSLQRMSALNVASRARLDILNLTHQSEIEAINEKLNKISQIEKKANGTVTNEERKLVIQKTALLEERNTIEKKMAIDSVEIERKRILDQEALAIESRNRLIKSAKEKLQTKEGKAALSNMELELKELDDFNHTKFSKHEDYENALADLQERQRKRRETMQLVALYDELEFAKAHGMETLTIEQSIADLKIKITEGQIKKKTDLLKKQAKTEEEIEREKEQLTKRLAEESFGFIQNLLSAKYTNQANALQEQIDKNNELKAAETERINNSTLSEQQKADQLAILNAKTNAQNEQLQKKQREAKMKEAKFERDAQALKILGETLFQAAKAGWITPTAILIEAIGAIQIASLYAKPLPKFAKGTSASPEGLAVTDEKGPELYIEPDGTAFMGSDKGPTLRYLKRDTKIIPTDQVNQYLMNHMMVKTAGMLENADQAGVRQEIRDLKDVTIWAAMEMKKAMSKPQKRELRIIMDNYKNSEYIRKNCYE